MDAHRRLQYWCLPFSMYRYDANYPLQVGVAPRVAAHSCDQLLIVTSGSGMVATEHEQHDINVGDVVHIKAGERH